MDFYDLAEAVENVLDELGCSKHAAIFHPVVRELEQELSVIADILYLIHPVPFLTDEERMEKIVEIRRKQAVKRMEEALE